MGVVLEDQNRLQLTVITGGRPTLAELLEEGRAVLEQIAVELQAQDPTDPLRSQCRRFAQALEVRLLGLGLPSSSR